MTLSASTTAGRGPERALLASYGWTDFRALTPVHESLTVAGDQETGWNILHPPTASQAFGTPDMEATADLRNMLAQGYLPLNVGGSGDPDELTTRRSQRPLVSFSRIAISARAPAPDGLIGVRSFAGNGPACAGELPLERRSGESGL